MTEPTTEAGRRHVRYLSDAVMPRDAAVIEVLAIEAEARADALREAADRVEAAWTAHGAVSRGVVILAILTETER